jgi:hypothetical protein
MNIFNNITYNPIVLLPQFGSTLRHNKDEQQAQSKLSVIIRNLY